MKSLEDKLRLEQELNFDRLVKSLEGKFCLKQELHTQLEGVEEHLQQGLAELATFLSSRLGLAESGLAGCSRPQDGDTSSPALSEATLTSH